MPVKIRLARRGRKKAAMYDIVVADSRSPRDGRFIEKLGTYNPQTNPATINFNEDKALDWVLKGAQPTDTVKAMLSYTGVMFRKHLQIGVAKGAVTQEQADARYQEWKDAKEAKITGKVEQLGSDKAAKKKANLEAEARVNAARAEAIRLKNAPAPEPEAVVEEEAPVAEADTTTEEGATEAPAADATEEQA
jgi:small subunit ribosomal protein S16